MHVKGDTHSQHTGDATTAILAGPCVLVEWLAINFTDSSADGVLSVTNDLLKPGTDAAGQKGGSGGRQGRRDVQEKVRSVLACFLGEVDGCLEVERHGISPEHAYQAGNCHIH